MNPNSGSCTLCQSRRVSLGARHFTRLEYVYDRGGLWIHGRVSGCAGGARAPPLARREESRSVCRWGWLLRVRRVTAMLRPSSHSENGVLWLREA